jgi:hypothetical protein
MNVTQYKGSQAAGSADTSRCPSPSIWADCPALEIESGVASGIHFFDDFLSGPRVAAGAEAATGKYLGFASTNATVLDGGEWGGSLVMTGTTDNEGVGFRTATAPFQIARAQGKLWFEARVKSSTIADTKHGIFVGLMDDAAITATSPITAAGAIADRNIVGFHRLEGDGDYFDSIYKANGVTQVTVGSDAAVIEADTYVKLGMVFNPADNVLAFYRNGVRLADSKTIPAAAGTDFPNDVRLGLVFSAVLATGTTPGSAEIDWLRCAQLAP